ncbi:MAG: CoA pyrophosphatase [Deltaproteobacteria bacterium]|nr:CoA pyrophosphatase [Deltaproteobacteria bacterium]
MPTSRLSAFFSRYQASRGNPDHKVRAAVLCPLFIEENHFKILFIKRSQTVRAHKGEISFPGGVKDHNDTSLAQTCLRETEEEIGIGPDRIQLFGTLDEVNTSTGYLVTPFLGTIENPYDLTLSTNEVDKIIRVPIADLYRPENQIDFYYFNGKILQSQIAFRCREHTIWGATAKILARLLELGQEHELFNIPSNRKFHLAS